MTVSVGGRPTVPSPTAQRVALSASCSTSRSRCGATNWEARVASGERIVAGAGTRSAAARTPSDSSGTSAHTPATNAEVNRLVGGSKRAAPEGHCHSSEFAVSFQAGRYWVLVELDAVFDRSRTH